MKSRIFCIQTGADGPTSVFFAGKVGSLFPAAAALTAVLVILAAVLLKKRK